MRSLEELRELSKLTLVHEELVAIARTASSNTDAKNRALVFAGEHGLDERVAMSCRWLKILRDRVSPQEFEDFVHKTKREVPEMTSQTIISQSKTEDYMLRINELCLCLDEKIVSLAKAARRIGFDPSRVETILGVTFDSSKFSELFCAHCVHTFRFELKLGRREAGINTHIGSISLDPIGKSGFIFRLDIWEDSIGVHTELIVDSIDYNEKQRMVIFHSNTRFYTSGLEVGGDSQKITLTGSLRGPRPLSLGIEQEYPYSSIENRLWFGFAPFVPAS